MSALTSAAPRPADHAVFRGAVWSTRVDLVVTDPGAIVAATNILWDELDRIDRIASRFRLDSELALLHRSARTGEPVAASPELCEAVTLALRAARLTDGAVDPTVGAAMCRLGYDRDFAAVRDGRPGSLPDPAPVPGWRAIVVDAERSTISMPTGTVLDLGATGKAWAADRIAAAVAERLGCGALVSLGGDLAVAGAPDGGFSVGIADICGDPAAPLAVSITAGGLATSGIGNRRWLLGGTPVHHVIDPSTGLPADTHWKTVSVAAASCVDANTASTAAMVKGRAAVEWLEALGVPARLARPDGSVVTVAGWPPDPRSPLATVTGSARP